MTNVTMARPAAGPADAAYLDEITMMLRDLLRQVIRVREPRVLTVIDEPANARHLPPDLIEHALQVIGIWLQLLNIAEENAAMRNRRQMETRSGPDQVPGSFSHAFATVAAANVPPEAVQKALDTVDVQPTITAHPTEAKRVTVLEIHRRIYLKLYELESPRWTPRERAGLLKALRTEIDLLVVFSNSPHPMHPAGEYPRIPVEISISRCEAAGKDDFCRNFRPECGRAMQLSERLFL